MTCPCKDCKNRSQHFHSSCKNCDKVRAARREEAESREPFLTRGDKIRRDAHRRGFCKF